MRQTIYVSYIYLGHGPLGPGFEPMDVLTTSVNACDLDRSEMWRPLLAATVTSHITMVINCSDKLRPLFKSFEM